MHVAPRQVKIISGEVVAAAAAAAAADVEVADRRQLVSLPAPLSATINQCGAFSSDAATLQPQHS